MRRTCASYFQNTYRFFELNLIYFDPFVRVGEFLVDGEFVVAFHLLCL